MPRGTSDWDNLVLQRRLWTPQQIDDGTLLGWYDAMDFSTISATSGSIDSWRDKSRFGRTISNTGAQRPTFSPTGARGWPGLSNTASQGLFHSTPYMYAAADTGGTGLTVCCVSYGQTTASGTMIGEASTASNNPIFGPLFVIAGLQAAFQQRNDANTTSTGSTSLLGTPQTFGFIWSLQTNTIPAGSGSVVTGRAFGVVGGSPRTRTYTGATTLTSFSIPGYYRVGNAITTAEVGTVCEYVIAAGTTLRTAQLIEGYLAWKWPTLTALNEDHPFVNRPPEIGQ